MKKTLTLLTLLLISVGVMAQLNVTSQRENTIEKLGQELRYDTSDSTYYLALTTTNQFDDPMIFKLGKGDKSAIQTLKDLISFLETSQKGDVIEVDNGFGETYNIRKYDNKNLVITANGYAGHRFIWMMKLDRWKFLIESKE